MFNVKRRRSDYLRIALMFVMIALLVITMGVTVLRAQKLNETDREAIINLKKDVSQLQKDMQQLQAQRFDVQLAVIENKLESLQWIGGAIVVVVIGQMGSHLWSLIVAPKQRKSSAQ